MQFLPSEVSDIFTIYYGIRMTVGLQVQHTQKTSPDNPTKLTVLGEVVKADAEETRARAQTLNFIFRFFLLLKYKEGRRG